MWDKVICGTCKCWLSKSDAQKVQIDFMYGCEDVFYCQEHKKPYNLVRYNLEEKKFYLTNQTIEVTEKGEVIKSRKE